MTTPPPTAPDSVGSLCERLRGLIATSDYSVTGSGWNVFQSVKAVVANEKLKNWPTYLPILLDALEGGKGEARCLCEGAGCALCDSSSPKASTLDADRERIARIISPRAFRSVQERLATTADWVEQLEAWPRRVHPERTTNIQFLMQTAALSIREMRSKAQNGAGNDQC